jgi:hypothetical protein
MNFVAIEDKNKNVEQIAGFMPFTEGTIVVGTLHKAIMKGDRKGFYLIKLIEPCTVNVDIRRPENTDNKTGQVTAPVGALVGVRAVHATRYLKEPTLLGKVVRIEFLETETRQNGGADGPTFLYHKIDVKVAA